MKVSQDFADTVVSVLNEGKTSDVRAGFNLAAHVLTPMNNSDFHTRHFAYAVSAAAKRMKNGTLDDSLLNKAGENLSRAWHGSKLNAAEHRVVGAEFVKHIKNDAEDKINESSAPEFTNEQLSEMLDDFIFEGVCRIVPFKPGDKVKTDSGEEGEISHVHVNQDGYPHSYRVTNSSGKHLENANYISHNRLTKI